MWLKGSTDIANFRQDLYSMLTGAVAAMQRGGGQASNGAQVSGTDAWTGLDATNFVIRSKREESPFSGEYGLYRGCPRFGAASASTVFQSTFQTQIGKPTFSGTYNGVTVRLHFVVYVSTVNTSPGNLSGTVVTWRTVNSDTGVQVATGTQGGWSGSSSTQVLNSGVSLTLTLGGSDSFVAGSPGNAVLWIRSYTTTYTQGIDYFPEAAKVTTAGVTVSNSSGGSNNYTGGGVDYTLVQEVHPTPAVSTTLGFGFSAVSDWGGTGAACGIAWNPSGSPPAAGANYFIPATYLMYGAYYQVPNIVSISSNFSLTGAPMDVWDPTLQVGRSVLTTATTPKTSLNTTVPYGQLFTGASQAGSTFVNFWISVKSDKIVMVFRGDPGQSGRTIVSSLQRLTPLVSADALPWFFMVDASNPTLGGPANQVSSKYVYENKYFGNPATESSLSTANLSQTFWYGPVQSGTGRPIGTGIATAGLPIQNPNNWDLRWWLYSIYTYCLRGGSNLAGTFDATKNSGIRSRFQGIYAVASDNFSSLDELTDNSGTYLLVIPSSVFGASGSQAYTAIAVTEE